VDAFEKKNKPITLDSKSLDNIESVIKTCDMIEFFGINQVNLMLLEISKCYINLFDGLIFFQKYFTMLPKLKEE